VATTTVNQPLWGSPCPLVTAHHFYSTTTMHHFTPDFAAEKEPCRHWRSRTFPLTTNALQNLLNVYSIELRKTGIKWAASYFFWPKETFQWPGRSISGRHNGNVLDFWRTNTQHNTLCQKCPCLTKCHKYSFPNHKYEYCSRLFAIILLFFNIQRLGSFKHACDHVHKSYYLEGHIFLETTVAIQPVF